MKEWPSLIGNGPLVRTFMREVIRVEIEFGLRPSLIGQVTAGRAVQKWRQFKDGNGVDCGKVTK